jgi:hypothetical protein
MAGCNECGRALASYNRSGYCQRHYHLTRCPVCKEHPPAPGCGRLCRACVELSVRLTELHRPEHEHDAERSARAAVYADSLARAGAIEWVPVCVRVAG